MNKRLFTTITVFFLFINSSFSQNVIVDPGQSALSLSGSTSFDGQPTGGISVGYTIQGRLDLGASINWSEIKRPGPDQAYAISPYLSYLISKKESGFSASIDVAYLGFLQGLDELNSFVLGLSFYRKFGRKDGFSFIPFVSGAVNPDASTTAFALGIRALPLSKNQDQFNFGPSLTLGEGNTIFSLGLGYTFGAKKEK